MTDTRVLPDPTEPNDPFGSSGSALPPHTAGKNTAPDPFGSSGSALPPHTAGKNTAPDPFGSSGSALPLGHAEKKSSEAEGWPAVEPLPDVRLPVPAFDLNLLPEALRPWIEDVAERLQCPPDFPAVGAMVSLGSVVGRRIGIRPKAMDDWTVVPNLWGGIVGRPGVLKTPSLAEAMRPLGRLAAKAREDHANAMREHAGLAELAKVRKETLHKELRAKGERRGDAAILADLRDLDGQEKPPAEVRYMTNDTTVEKLGELLAVNPAGVLVFRDELTGWLRSLDREGREGDRSFYLEAWNGTGAYTYDRIGRGTLHIEAATVSVLGGIQPGPLAAYVRAAAGDGNGADGLLQRFQLLVWPDDPADWRNADRWPNTDARNAAFKIFERLAVLDPLKVGGRDDDGLPYLRFDPAAQEAFDEWRHGLEARLRGEDSEVVEAHLSKYRSLVPSLALLCHLADNPYGGPVTLSAMLRAADWCEYLEAHARRLYATGIGADHTAAHALASRIRRGEVVDGCSPRDIYRRCWAGLDKEATTRALYVLEGCGWLRIDEVVTGGRPSLIVSINPSLRDSGVIREKFPERHRLEALTELPKATTEPDDEDFPAEHVRLEVLTELPKATTAPDDEDFPAEHVRLEVLTELPKATTAPDTDCFSHEHARGEALTELPKATEQPATGNEAPASGESDAGPQPKPVFRCIGAATDCGNVVAFASRRPPEPERTPPAGQPPAGPAPASPTPAGPAPSTAPPTNPPLGRPCTRDEYLRAVGDL